METDERMGGMRSITQITARNREFGGDGRGDVSEKALNLKLL